MSTLLIRNISTLVTCDDLDQILHKIDMYVENGTIIEIGPNLTRQAGRVLDGKHMICYPGLINTHHHFYQIFTRNLAMVQGMELFPWLRTLYEIWKNLALQEYLQV